MALDIFSQLDQLVPNPTCFYEILEPIVHTCKTPENVQERTWISVQLSLCEFAVSGIDYPAICHEFNELRKCTQLLETKSTWWTTFSGNYRHISLVCKEYQPQYEAQRVVNTFKNASSLFNSFQSDLDKDFQIFRQTKQEATDILIQLNAEIASSLILVQQKLSQISQITDMKAQDFEIMGEEFSKHANNAIARLKDASQITYDMDAQARNLESRFNSFGNMMSQIEKEHSGAANLLQESVKQTVHTLENTNEALNGTASILKALAKVFHVFGLLCGPLGLLLIVLILFVYARSRSQRIHPRNKEEMDIIFY